MSREQDTYRRWLLEMRRQRLFHAGERVGVAVSGGPDSMLLLDFMVGLARELGLALAVVHFNHRLRGAESEADERLVRERAQELGLDLLRSEADVARVARERRKNLEATARHLRYRFFFSLVSQRRLDKVVTAHTANDQAETVLLRLLRGSGTRGLGGIHPVLDGSIVRPFLSLTRPEVEREVAARGLAFRTDSTNQDTRLARNRIRQQLLPWLEKKFNPHAVRSLAQLADRARDDEAYLEEQARERALAWLVREEETRKIPGRRLDEFPPAIARRVLRQMLVAAGTRPGAITQAMIDGLRRLAHEGQSGTRLPLPGDLEARKEFEWLVIARPSPVAPSPGFVCSLKPPAEIPIPALALTLRFRIVEMTDAKTPEGVYTNAQGAWLDADKLGAPLILRSWRPGDRFCPSGSRKPLKLKEVFQRRRIPLGQRPWWPVLVSAGVIVWVRGLPPPAAVSVSPASHRRLAIDEEPFRPANGGKQEP